MITFVSLFGLDFGALVAGGALLTEVVFGIHGVGYLTYQSLTNLDLPAIMATVVLRRVLHRAGQRARRHRATPGSIRGSRLAMMARRHCSTVRNLKVSFRTEDGLVRAVDECLVHRVAEGETLGIVGESGSGKSVTDDVGDAADQRPERAFRGRGALQGPRPDGAEPGPDARRSAAPRSP